MKRRGLPLLYGSMIFQTHIPHMIVKKHMEERYGVVLSVERGRWKHYYPGIPNGIRVLRMHLFKSFPSYIEIEGQMTSKSGEKFPLLSQNSSTETKMFRAIGSAN